jgi:hypothetical protein
MRQGVHDPSFTPLPDCRAARYAMLLPGRSMVGAGCQEMGAGYSLEVRDPTQDKQLLEFCLAIPEAIYGRGGVDRRLIRRGLEGLMAPEVLNNRKQGLQAADIGWRLLASREEVNETLSQMARSPAASEYLNLAKMRQVWESLQANVTLDISNLAIAILLRGLIAGLFVSQLIDGGKAQSLPDGNPCLLLGNRSRPQSPFLTESDSGPSFPRRPRRDKAGPSSFQVPTDFTRPRSSTTS